MSFDPAEDWSLWDGSTSVTYTPYVASTDGYGTSLTGVPALFRTAQTREVTMPGGVVVVTNTRVHIPAASVASPAVRDKVTDTAGVVWIVADFEAGTLKTRQALTVAKL